jgi:S-adenosylmethionine/arginine decarboxylase-like enzyme
VVVHAPALVAPARDERQPAQFPGHEHVLTAEKQQRNNRETTERQQTLRDSVPPSLTHDAADFRGVPASLLRDQAALSGLLIAASGAAGLTTVEPPVMRLLPRGGLVIILLLDIGHVAVHTVPDEGVLALDLLVSARKDARKAIEVVTRRLNLRPVRATHSDRG